jgi:hypothetical protein
MATITVDLTANQIVGAKFQFATQDNVEALTKFRNWVSENADGWYADYVRSRIAEVNQILLDDPSKIADALAWLNQ